MKELYIAPEMELIRFTPKEALMDSENVTFPTSDDDQSALGDDSYDMPLIKGL